MSEVAYRKAPPGFTNEQWEQFDRDGYLLFENALSQEQIDHYLAAVDRVVAADLSYKPNLFYAPENVVERDPAFIELIDHPRHVGYPYDIYGELLKLHLSQIMVRPKGAWVNAWHPDGPRATPYQVFSPDLPLQFKVSYWLTDLPEPKMGNLVILPGSHRQQYNDIYDTHESVPGELIVCVPKGSVILLNASTWHRVDANDSDVVRKNIFLTYAPSWISPQDRYQSDPEWLETLNREQRIIMRSYPYPYANARPPTDNIPLFLDRETGSDRDPDVYRDHVIPRRRKRLTTVEKLRQK